MHSYCYLSHDRVALILEYAIGGTLGQYLKEKKTLMENEVRHIFKQILNAIEYCHRCQIFHRDLKLENIVFSDEARTEIKIIDFGVAGLFEGEINKAGSIAYMAPEVVGGWNYASHPEIDIWSLGCILYELIVGEKLFQGETNQEKKEKIVKGKFKLSKGLSLESSNLIHKMLKVNSQERISIFQCFSHPWILGAKFVEESNIEIETQESAIPPSCKSKSFKVVASKTTANCQQHKENQATSSKSFRMNLFQLFDNQEFNFNNFLRTDFRIQKSTPKVGKSGLITKVTNKISLFDLNYGIMKNNGKMVSYLQPIGHTKQQKQQNERIRNILYKSDEKDSINAATTRQSFASSNTKKIKALKFQSNKLTFPHVTFSTIATERNEDQKASNFKVSSSSNRALSFSIGLSNICSSSSKIGSIKMIDAKSITFKK